MVFGKSERPVATTFAPAARGGGRDLRLRHGKGEDDRVRRHGADHLLADDAARGETDEDVRALQHLGQAAAAAREIRLLGEIGLRPVHALGTVFVERTRAVADDEIAHPGPGEQASDADPGDAGAGDDDLDVLELLPTTFSALMRPPRTRIAVP